MREILFRGKQEYKNKEWVFGSLHSEYGETDKNGQHKIDYRILGMRGECDYVLSETVGQFTGLTDKNGKKIFEGDILDHTIQAEVLTNRGVVVWDCENARWALQLNTMKPCFYMHNPKSVEVIGNIHDNPELSEVNNGEEV